MVTFYGIEAGAHGRVNLPVRSGGTTLNVLLTIDTEVYPLRPKWRAEHLRGDLARDIYGVTERGTWGLSYQIEVLNSYGLKAVFLVEGLFAEVVGMEPLERIVREIRSNGHEVQIHVHPEWLDWMPHAPFAHNGRETLRQFSLNEQTRLIQMAATNLRAAGATDLCALRAGDFAANGDTLRALSELGIRYDTSLNPCLAWSLDGLQERRHFNRPVEDVDVQEVPVSFWHSHPFPPRHAQICATSAGELRHALWEASENNRTTFVIVSHSFELLKKRRQMVNRPSPDWVVVRRFRKLCQFLGQHRDRFRTCGFGDLDPHLVQATHPQGPLRGSRSHTAWRGVEQLYRRLM